VFRVGGKFVFAEDNLEVALFGDLERGSECLGHIFKERGHFFRRLQIKFGTMIAHPIFVVDLRAGLDAEQNIVRGGMVLEHIMNVVGRDDLQGELFGVAEKFVGDLLLLRDAVVGNLEIEVARREDVFEIVDGALGILRAPGHNVTRHFAGQAGAGADEAL
jgi:hypothetical protein